MVELLVRRHRAGIAERRFSLAWPILRLGAREQAADVRRVPAEDKRRDG